MKWQAALNTPTRRHCCPTAQYQSRQALSVQSQRRPVEQPLSRGQSLLQELLAGYGPGQLARAAQEELSAGRLVASYPPMADNLNVVLIETSTFTKQIVELLDDEDYRRFQTSLAANPGMGDLIQGGAGIRKVRVALPGRGKRGGGRVIYYWAVRRDLILLLYAFPKNVRSDLTRKQVDALAKIVRQEFGYE